MAIVDKWLNNQAANVSAREPSSAKFLNMFSSLLK